MSDISQRQRERERRIIHSSSFTLFTILSRLFSAKGRSSSFTGMETKKEKRPKNLYIIKAQKREVHKVPFYKLQIFQPPSQPPGAVSSLAAVSSRSPVLYRARSTADEACLKPAVTWWWVLRWSGLARCSLDRR